MGHPLSQPHTAQTNVFEARHPHSFIHSNKRSGASSKTGACSVPACLGSSPGHAHAHALKAIQDRRVGGRMLADPAMLACRAKPCKASPRHAAGRIAAACWVVSTRPRRERRGCGAQAIGPSQARTTGSRYRAVAKSATCGAQRPSSKQSTWSRESTAAASKLLLLCTVRVRLPAAVDKQGATSQSGAQACTALHA